MKPLKQLLILLAVATAVSPDLTLAEPVQLEDGERVVFLGNTFIEREGNYGHIETHLALGAGSEGKKVTFRNLGWSGDTVFGDARSYFGPPQEGFDRLKKHLQMLKPTTLVVCYGAVAAFDGEKGVQKFLGGYKRLLDMAKKETGARIVLLSPPPCETLGPPLPDMAAQNERLAIYRDAIRAFAQAEGHEFADVFAALREGKAKRSAPWTDNGLHFTDEGYRQAAPAIAKLFGFDKPLPVSSELDDLQGLILEKNKLFFHRWRPANETYLHGFRKHEQGNNAREIPQFDPLVAEKDEEIQQLSTKLSK